MRKYFCEDYVIPSPRNCMKTKKKRSSPKLEEFFGQNLVKTIRRRPKKKKKKRCSPTVEVLLLRNQFFPAIWYYIRPEFVGLFFLIIQRSNLDGGTPKSRWGTLNLNEGTLTLDGGTHVPLRPLYN